MKPLDELTSLKCLPSLRRTACGLPYVRRTACGRLGHTGGWNRNRPLSAQRVFDRLDGTLSVTSVTPVASVAS